MFLAPGVTPWKTTLPGVHNGANNPGIRVFDYDRGTLQVKVGDAPTLHGLSPWGVTATAQGLLTQYLHIALINQTQR